MNAQLAINGTAKAIVVNLRPILSAKIPAGRAPRNAPIAKQEPTHDPKKKSYNIIKLENFIIFK